MPIAYENPIRKGEYLPTLQEIMERKKPEGVPNEAAWIWGPDDELGRLNLLTPEHIKSVVASEQKYGLVSSLNWDITLPKHPALGRQACEHCTAPFADILVNDDILHMNTQSGSQIDGFRHVAHQTSKIFYNNLRQEEITGPGRTTRCGMQACSKHGIVGRGLLVDFARWAEEKGIKYDPFATYAISLDQIKEVAAWEGVEFGCSDILLIRSGWMRRYNVCLRLGLEEEFARASAEHPQAIGVDQSEEMKTWLHDQYFALVGGDQPTFEAWPGRTTPILHEYLLACWGVMIGEMLDRGASQRLQTPFVSSKSLDAKVAIVKPSPRPSLAALLGHFSAHVQEHHHE